MRISEVPKNKNLDTKTDLVRENEGKSELVASGGGGLGVATTSNRGDRWGPTDATKGGGGCDALECCHWEV